MRCLYVYQGRETIESCRSFTIGREERRRARLQRALLAAEASGALVNRTFGSRSSRASRFEAALDSSETGSETKSGGVQLYLARTLDNWVGDMICCNASFVAISVDYSEGDSPVWPIIDITFSAVFYLELILNTFLNGCRSFMCGPHRRMNIFDVSLAILDIFVVVMARLSSSGTFIDAPLLRLARLSRPARCVRLLNSSRLADLFEMIAGLKHVRQLAALLGLLFGACYCLLKFRPEDIGADPKCPTAVNLATQHVYGAHQSS